MPVQAASFVPITWSPDSQYEHSASGKLDAHFYRYVGNPIVMIASQGNPLFTMASIELLQESDRGQPDPVPGRLCPDPERRRGGRLGLRCGSNPALVRESGSFD